MTSAPLVCRTCGLTISGPLGDRCPKDGAPLIAAEALHRFPDDPLLGYLLGGRHALVDRRGGDGLPVYFTADGALVHIAFAEEGAGATELASRVDRIARLNHDAIAPIVDHGQDTDALYVVCQPKAGRALRSWLNQEGRLLTSQALPTILKLLEGLDAAHKADVVHGCLTLDEISIIPTAFGEDRLCVTGFGLAGETLPDGGWLRVQAPELMVSGPSPSTDLYSVGALLFELLVGRPPFLGATPEALSEAKTKIPRIPAELGVPEILCAVIYRAMGRSPEARFPTAGAMLMALESLARASEEEEHAPTKLAPAPNVPLVLRSTTDLRVAVGAPSAPAMRSSVALALPAAIQGGKPLNVDAAQDRPHLGKYLILGIVVLFIAAAAMVLRSAPKPTSADATIDAAQVALAPDAAAPIQDAAPPPNPTEEAEALYTKALEAAKAKDPDRAKTLLVKCFARAIDDTTLRERAAKEPAFLEFRKHDAFKAFLPWKGSEPRPARPRTNKPKPKPGVPSGIEIVSPYEAKRL